MSKSNKKPIELGNFDNFQTVGDGEKLKVFAYISLNKNGEDYYNDGIFEGISLEIPEDNLTKIALLPIGVNPVVAGAEFQSESYTDIYKIDNVIDSRKLLKNMN